MFQKKHLPLEEGSLLRDKPFEEDKIALRKTKYWLELRLFFSWTRIRKRKKSLRRRKQSIISLFQVILCHFISLWMFKSACITVRILLNLDLLWSHRRAILHKSLLAKNLRMFEKPKLVVLWSELWNLVGATRWVRL